MKRAHQILRLTADEYRESVRRRGSGCTPCPLRDFTSAFKSRTPVNVLLVWFVFLQISQCYLTMALPGGMSPIFLGGLVAMGIGILLHIVGMATPAWSTITGTSFGLKVDVEYGIFKSCTGSSCVEVSNPPSDWAACQAFAVIGILIAFVALAMAILHVVLPLVGKSSKKLFPMISAAASFAAFGSILLAIIIWAASVHSEDLDLGYSFALSLVGGILLAIGGALVFLGSRGQAPA